MRSIAEADDGFQSESFVGEGRHLLIDPSLRDEGGHHLALAQGHAVLLGPDRLWCAINRYADPDLRLPSAHVLRAFRYTMNEAARVRRYGRAATAAGTLAQTVTRRFARTGAAGAEPRRGFEDRRAAADAAHARSLHTDGLRAAWSMFQPGRRDHVVFESGDAEQALALAEVVESAGAGGATLQFRLMYDDVPRHRTDLTWASAVARLERAASGIEFSTETRAFAEALAQVTGRRVAVRPHPSSLSARPAPADRTPFVLLVPGEARSDKGLPLVGAVVNGLRSAFGDGVSIRVQGGSAQDGVEPLPARLDAAAYAEAWASCHAALLLHDTTVYRLRGSGTVCDAVAARRPFVCLEGTSLAEWTADGNAIAAVAEPAGIVEAVGRLVDGYDGFLARTTLARARLTRLTERELASGIGHPNGSIAADRPV